MGVGGWGSSLKGCSCGKKFNRYQRWPVFEAKDDINVANQ